MLRARLSPLGSRDLLLGRAQIVAEAGYLALKRDDRRRPLGLLGGQPGDLEALAVDLDRLFRGSLVGPFDILLEPACFDRMLGAELVLVGLDFGSVIGALASTRARVRRIARRQIAGVTVSARSPAMSSPSRKYMTS